MTVTRELLYPDFSARFRSVVGELAGRALAVIGHARPDGDCIGSQISLARTLRALGNRVVCVNPDPVPRRLQFLTREETFHTVQTLPSGELTAIFVDCADHARAGQAILERFPSPFLTVDHHLSNGGFAKHNFIDTTSAATCEILAGMIFDNDFPVDPVTAQALYTGILTDTGQFRFTSTSRRTFLLAAELMARGAKPTEAGFELYERETTGKLQLLQRFLASLTLELDDRVCIGTLHNGVFEETGATVEDTEGLVDYARCIDGVEVGVLIEERPDGTVKASLRCKDPRYRLDQVAAQFNGGGHACAAGLSLKQPTSAFRAELLRAIAAQIEAVESRSASLP